jgi:hypothetical protein
LAGIAAMCVESAREARAEGASSTVAHPTRPNARSVAELIGKALDPLARKRGLARAELIAWWPEIVGAAYAGRTAPERIRWARDGRAATLVVRCDPSVALPFAHETSRVRERVNSYFGYPAVAAVRIVQQPVGVQREKTAPAPPRELPPALAGKLEGIDGPLKESLRALGKNILART